MLMVLLIFVYLIVFINKLFNVWCNKCWFFRKLIDFRLVKIINDFLLVVNCLCWMIFLMSWLIWILLLNNKCWWLFNLDKSNNLVVNLFSCVVMV